MAVYLVIDKFELVMLQIESKYKLWGDTNRWHPHWLNSVDNVVIECYIRSVNRTEMFGFYRYLFKSWCVNNYFCFNWFDIIKLIKW